MKVSDRWFGRTFAAILLVASHLFIEAQSAKQFKGSIDFKITTNNCQLAMTGCG
jgi:hypothetical protein